MNPNPRSFGLDLMRAIAISCVVTAHFVKKMEFSGFWGVELFFGLSGFLIGQILWRSFSNANEWGFKYLTNFWSRRWWRTLPNYYLFLVLNICYYFFYNKNLLPGGAGLLSFFWFGQTICGYQGGFFGESWSLCVEEWFYSLFPLLVFTLKYSGLKHRPAFVSALIVFFIGCGFIRYWLIINGKGVSVRGFTFARLDAISFGVCISYIFSNTQVGDLKKIIAFIVGFSGILGSVATVWAFHLTYNEVRGNLILLAVVPMSFALMLPLITELKAPKGSFSFVSKIIEKISLWSYSLYLCHMILLLTAYRLVEYLKDSNYNSFLAKLLSLVCAIIISSLLFKYFELPFTRKRPKEINSNNV